MGSRTPALLQCFDWHHRCVPGLWKSGEIPHLFRTSVPPYRQRLAGNNNVNFYVFQYKMKQNWRYLAGQNCIDDIQCTASRERSSAIWCLSFIYHSKHTHTTSYLKCVKNTHPQFKPFMQYPNNFGLMPPIAYTHSARTILVTLVAVHYANYWVNCYNTPARKSCHIGQHIQVTETVRWGAFTCVGWQVTLCDPIWQVMSRSCEMGVPLTAIHSITFLQQYNEKNHSI